MTTNPAIGQFGRHSRAKRGNDFYETPACAIEALIRIEQLPTMPLWECAAGNGAIVKVLRDHGRAVVAGDIVRRDFELHFVADFLKRTKAPPDCEMALTNPPFSLITEFVDHGLTLVPRVIVLAPLGLLASARRAKILKQLARVHVFAERLPMMHRHDWTGPRASSAINHAWFVFDRQHSGPAALDRISIHPA